MSKQKADSLSHILSLSDLGVSVPKKLASEKQFAVWIRALMQNWRQGTVGVKGRSDVARSNKKPWKQKGTGRARAGSARSPLWRGGGVIFGPQARVKQLSVPKSIRAQVLNRLLIERIDDKKVITVDWTIEGTVPKTAQAAKMLQSISLQNKKVTVFLSPDDVLNYGSFTNMPQIQVLLFDQPNAYDLANSQYWLVLKKDVDSFKHMVGQWQRN